MIYNLGTNLELFIKSRYYQQRIASCDQKKQTERQIRTGGDTLYNNNNDLVDI